MLSYFDVSKLIEIDSVSLEQQKFNQVLEMGIPQDWNQRSKAKTERNDSQSDF